jgi:hypothetical protein
MLRRIIVIASLLIVVAALLIFMTARGCSGKRTASVSPANQSPVNAATPKPSATPVAETHVSSGALADMPLGAAIIEAEQQIANGADAKTVLDALRKKLLAADPKAASAAMCAYLASGRDVATGMPFQVGPNGEMVSVTSMRGYLLDLLLTVDPQAALAEAEAVFDAKTSADEYAICLRNVGKIDTSDAGRAYVGKRALELLADAKLAANATSGFAEAFDAVVYSGDTSAFTTLAAYTEKDKGIGLNMPAFMAMDRMVIDDTEASLKELSDHSTLLNDRPLTRAGFYARADLSDDAQLAYVTQYVQGLDPSGEEAVYFFSLVPNTNFTLTDGILTTRVSVTADYVQTRYDAALKTINIWLSDSRYTQFKTELESAKARLQNQMGK